MLKKIVILLVSFILAACGGKKNPHSETSQAESTISIEESYRLASNKLDNLTLALKEFDEDQSMENIDKVMDIYENLDFSISVDEASEEDLHKYKKLQLDIDSAKIVVEKTIGNKIKQIHKNLVNEQDHLLTSTEVIPVYLKRGDKLFLNFETQGNVTIKLYNADSRSTIKTYQGKKVLHDSLKIANSAIYLLEMKPVGNTYVDFELEKSVNSFKSFKEKGPKIKVETVPCTAKDFGAQADPGINIVNVFEEPHKVTLRSQGKAFFSGNSRTVVAMQIPAGSTDILYNLRISTSQENRGDDGEFCKDMTEAYSEIKILGRTVVEKKLSVTNLLREMLNTREPYREEEAYCNLYVFTDPTTAKKFSEGADVSSLKYDVNLSKQGTQSCNDRIPINKGVKTLYFGFENTRFRYSVYLWLESLATTPVTEYYRNVYSLE
ncbi:MAG: hypothetical protein K5890_07865 [Bacteroidales bacterium]|nr:hypothetical protein [Bacteroidales bacterium]